MAINYRLVGSSTGSGSTSAGTVTAGSTLVYCTTSDSGATLNSVSGGGTYTQQGGTRTTSSGSKIYAFVAPNVAGGGSVSATPSWTGTPFATSWLVEVTGADPASLDIAVGVSAKASPYLQATGTLAQAAEAVIAFVANDDGSSVDYTATSPAGLTIFGENNDSANWWTSAVAGVVVSSTASISPTFTLSAGTNVAMIVLSFKEAGAGTTPAITSTSSATPANGSTLTITGTDFGASQGAGSVTIGGVVQAVTSWADTSITVLVARGTNKYGSAVNVVVTDNALASSSPYALTGLTPQSGWSYVNITTPNTSVGARISTTPDLSSGDQVAYDNVGGLVSVAADATFSVGTSVQSFDFEVWSSPEGWGFAATQYIVTTQATSRGRYAARVVLSSRGHGSLYLLNPVNWGAVPLGVEKWFAPELTAAVAAGTHPSTGALSAQAASIAGTADHRTLHTTTGALNAQVAAVSGTAAHQHATTGALSAQAATLAGTAAHLTLHATTGALTAQAATIAGSAAHQHATTGALSAQAAAIAGTAAHENATAGALTAQAAVIAGTADHRTLHATTGALSSQAGTISGAAQHQHATTGALTAQAATIDGAADHTVAGSTHSTSGALAAQDAAIAGAAAHLTLHTTSGALSAQASSIAGVAQHQHVATGALAAQSATVDGAAAHLSLHTSTGALAAAAAAISGAAAHEHASSGALTAQAATVDGTSVHSAAGTHDATGALTAGDASLSGVAEHVGTDAGLLDPKLIARKRKPNQNITFKGAGGPGPRKKREEHPEPVKPKVSPLLLGLMARGLAMPTPAAPMLPEPAPVLDVASIAQAVLLEALPAAIEVPKPEAAPTPEQQLAARVQELEQQMMQLQADLAALRQPPEPAQATARDPVHEALHALLPALSEPIDLDALPEEPEQPPEIAAPAPAAPPKMTREEIDAENERRARLAAEILL